MVTNWRLTLLPLIVIAAAVAGIAIVEPEPVHKPRTRRAEQRHRFVNRDANMPEIDLPFDESSPAWVEVASIPLHDGKLDLETFGGVLLKIAGYDMPLPQTGRYVIELTHVDAVTALKGLESISGDILHIDHAHRGRLDIHVDRVARRRHLRRLQGHIRRLVSIIAPHLLHRIEFGDHARFIDRDGNAVKLEDATLPKRVVLLLPGMHRPGDIFDDLVPALQQRGHAVVRARYADDTSLRIRADRTEGWLTTLRSRGVTHIDIVAHGTAGLVARYVLVSPYIYHGKGSEQEKYPTVDRLIMLGTPHAGAALAEVELPDEAADQAARVLSEQGILFGEAMAASDLARRDLAPGSSMLLMINGYPHPRDVAITNIIGRASPIEPREINAIEQAWRSAGRDDLDYGLPDFVQAARQLVDGSGDGAVSVTSARLKGAENHEVDANHVTMLRRLSTATGTPPAIPIVIETLSSGD